MLLWWLSTALASDITFLGFAYSGQFAAWQTTYEQDGIWVAEVRTLHIPESGWAHWPIEHRDADKARAERSVMAKATEQLALTRITSNAEGEPLPWWTEVDEARRERLPRSRTVRVRLAEDRIGVLQIRELPAQEACPLPNTVATAWIWTAPDAEPVDLFRRGGPSRVPPCVLRYDLVDVRQGPRRAVVFLFRAWVATGPQDVDDRYVPASVLWP